MSGCRRLAVRADRVLIAFRPALYWVAAVAVYGCAATPSDPAPAQPGDAAADTTSDAHSSDSAQDTAAQDGADVPAAGTLPPAPPPWLDSLPWQPPVFAECPAPPSQDDPLGQLLASVGLDRTAGIAQSLIAKFGGAIANDPQRLPHFHKVQEDMDGLGACWSGQQAQLADWAVQSDHPRTHLLATAIHALGRASSVGGAFPTVDAQQPLVTALADLHGIQGEPFDASAAQQALGSVPLSVQKVAAQLVYAAMEAADLREAWLSAAGATDRKTQWYAKAPGVLLTLKAGMLDPDLPKDSKAFDLETGHDFLLQGALRMTQALDEADWQPARSQAAFAVSLATPLGKVVLRGGGDDVWHPDNPDLQGDILLALDTGGNDTWLIRAGANTSASNPVAIAVDLGGNDRYDYVPAGDTGPWEGLMPPDEDSRTVASPGYAPWSLSQKNRQGSGRLGIGILMDLGSGSDQYKALRLAQGHSSLGVGMLWDDGGDDLYSGEAGVQAAAIGGVALLYDGGGNDQFQAIHNAQGFAFIGSSGLLYDRAGNDDYLCRVSQPLAYPSPQTPGSANSSLCQGCAFGFRRDATGTHRSGGVALLRDAKGDDSYLGATFVQGVGYWFGTGILADGAGNDQYDGLFYAQGAAAHFALGFLLEGGGDDRYGLRLQPIHSTLGLGHDFSSALLVEQSGNDVYRGPSRSLGAAKCHGYGLFVDRDGADQYTVSDDRAIGWATDYDGSPGDCGKYKVVASYGFFLDTGGNDSYSKPSVVKPKVGLCQDGKSWVSDDPSDTEAKELSGGIDAASGDPGVSAP